LEARIYLEAELMYKKVQNFKSIEGNLRKWEGHIKTKDKDLTLTVYIELPETYPETPPILKIKPPIIHPNIDKNGSVRLNLINYWKPEYHLYQVINNLKAVFWRNTPTKLHHIKMEKVKVKSKPKKELENVNTRLINGKTQNGIPKREMEKKLKMQIVLDNFSTTLKDKVLDLQSDKISIINLVNSLDENFEKGEISPEIYSRLYKKYYNILVLINDELKKIRQIA